MIYRTQGVLALAGALIGIAITLFTLILRDIRKIKRVYMHRRQK
jgi:HAMP domain-containing protein